MPDGNPISMVEVIDAAPLDPRTCPFDRMPCHSCNRTIAAGETFWTSRPAARTPRTFCFQCGVGIGLEIGHHPDLDMLAIPAYFGGPRPATDQPRNR